jgi:hypothetical protein
MKKILTGLSNNINLNKQKIKIWSESFKRHSDGEIILIAANANEEDINVCNELGIKYHLVSLEDTYHINHKRLEHTRDFIKQSDGDIFLVTDVFDVLFQSDPFKKMDFKNYDLFTSGEGILVCEESWNGDVINKVFPTEINVCLKTEIVCSGVIAGKKQQMVDLYNKMFNMCEAGLDGHNIKDQAALIIMIAKNEIDRLKVFTIDDGWAMHCQSAGPTYFFEAWGLRKALEKRYGVPKLIDDKIYTANNQLFDIVHQFNRIEEWNKILTTKYE